MSPNAEILEPTQANIQSCAQRLAQGELVALPTETVYGLAANALNETALRQIFSVKGRPLIDPLIVHCRDLEQAKNHVIEDSRLHKLADAFWPGPLTVVLPKKASIPDIATAGLPNVAIRIPAHPVFQAVLQAVNFPIAAPSANPFGYVSPTQAKHVQATLGARIPAILDGGPSEHGLESTIIDLREPGCFAILREGPIPRDAITAILGAATESAKLGRSDHRSQVAPGNLTQHYSPNTELTTLQNGTAEEFLKASAIPADEACILIAKPQSGHLADNIFWLSEDNQLEKVAHNLFDLIQRLDRQGYRRIHIECAPSVGIGLAINDRIGRAAAKFK